MAITRKAQAVAETVSAQDAADNIPQAPQVVEAKSETDYLNTLRSLMSAHVGVIITRTNEPYRVIDIINRRCYLSGKDLYTWDAFYGWQWSVGTMPDDKEKRAKTPDKRERKFDINTAAMTMAIREIAAIKPAGVVAAPAAKNKDARPDFSTVGGVFLMNNAHWPLLEGKKDPAFIQALKTYAHEWLYKPPADKTLKKTLIMVCPQDFNVPPEIEADVAILDMQMPTQNELSEILSLILTQDLVDLDLQYDSKKWLPYIRSAAGLTAHEFTTNTLRLIGKQPRYDDHFVTKNITDEVVADMTREIGFIKAEMLKRTQLLEMMDAEDIKNVGGLDLFKDWLSKRADCFSDEAKSFGIKPPKGVTLVGTPGTGKSLVAKCTSKILGVPLIRFDVGKVFNSLVGASEQRMRVALNLVDAMAPCVLLLDEVDKMFDRNTGGGDSGVSKRIMGSFLTWMQESKAPVFVIMTANRTSGLPPEMLRRGRIDEIFSVTLPSAPEREEILKIHIKKRGHNADTINLQSAVAMSNGYIPAELESAVQEALIKAYHEGKDLGEPATLKASHIESSLAEIIPLSQSFGEDFSRMHEWCTKNARPASSFTPDALPVIANSVSGEGGSPTRGLGGSLDG